MVVVVGSRNISSLLTPLLPIPFWVNPMWWGAPEISTAYLIHCYLYCFCLILRGGGGGSRNISSLLTQLLPILFLFNPMWWWWGAPEISTAYLIHCYLYCFGLILCGGGGGAPEISTAYLLHCYLYRFGLILCGGGLQKYQQPT